jgi:methionyl-tRNA synthetase
MSEQQTSAAEQRWYITTSIPYVNAKPHIGHALEYILTDALARYQHGAGKDVWFLTGTDENSLKNVQAAEREGLPTQALVDRNAAQFYALRETLDLSFDDFIRTSVEARHLQGVQTLWQACQERGDIYRKSYRGLYCVGCEAFYTEDELVEGLCPDHLVRPELVEEENYFFRLSRYTDQLLELIELDRLRIVPQTRKNEVLSFVRRGLEDFSISRSHARARGWGIPVPDDPTQVMYVWFDALGNYITALGYGEVEGPTEDRGPLMDDERPRTEDRRPPTADRRPLTADRSGEVGGELPITNYQLPITNLYQHYWLENPHRVHVIGKNIIRFHAVYWPAMLLSAGVPVPSTLVVHGFVTVEGRKVGKSLGNAIDPVELVERYGVDALRYYLLREVPATADGDFSLERFVRSYNAELADQLGNLLNRLVNMVGRYYDGRVPAPGPLTAAEQGLVARAEGLAARLDEAMAEFDPQAALGVVLSLVSAANKYIVEVEPWQVAKQRQASGEAAALAEARLATTLYCLAEALRLVAQACEPFLPTTSAKIAAQLGITLERVGTWAEVLRWGRYQPGTMVQLGGVIFPKLVLEA